VLKVLQKEEKKRSSNTTLTFYGTGLCPRSMNFKPK